MKVVESFVDRTGLADASVDAVLMVDVYHHLDQPEVFVVDVARALKPGGMMHIVDFDPGKEDASAWVKGHVHLDADTVARQVEGTGLFAAGQVASVPLTANRMASFQRK